MAPRIQRIDKMVGLMIAVHGLLLLFGWLEYKLFVIVWGFMNCATYFYLIIRVPLIIFINSLLVFKNVKY
ncbi:hypothetical protein [Bacillus cereus]|uniref:hypothetical protein n=1 Tax=Bacillus cereus TaxID=1396 RepID=UPI001F5BFF88